MVAVPGSLFPRNGVAYAFAGPGADPGVTATCDVLWYGNRCSPRVDTSQLNAISSELLNVINSQGTYDCSQLDNLYLAIMGIAEEEFWDQFPAGSGILVKTAGDAVLYRTITGTAGEISVANGNGLAGNPTISLPAALAFGGKTVTGGTFASPTINSPVVSGGTFTAGTYTNGTINNATLNSCTININTVAATLETRIGAFGTIQFIQNIGWSTAFQAWSWTLRNNTALHLSAHNTTDGTTTSTAMIVTNANGYVQFPQNVQVVGNLSKGSGTFRIDHPLDPENRDLVHGFIEGPRHDLIYRGSVKLTSGRAVVNIDDDSNMADGTFEALTTNREVTSLYNKSGFSRLRATAIDGNEFEIICEDEDSDDIVVWTVMAERNDPFIKSISDTDENGRLIVEQDKPE